MITIAGVVFGVLIGYARGGRLGALARLRLESLWLLLIAVLIQFFIFPSSLSPQPLIAWGTGALYIASYAITALFLLLNWSTLWPIFPGTVLNATVIAANGGFMPASLEALRRSGRGNAASIMVESSDGTLANVVAMGENTRLNILGDWLYVPEWVPMSNSFSIGDLLLMLGIAWIICAGMCGAVARTDS